MTDHWFNIIGADVFDLCPPDVPESLWRPYHEKFKAADNGTYINHPVQVDVELNGGCNMTCPFCLHGYEKIPNKLMEFDTFDRIVRQAIDLGVRTLKLNYINEPLMRRDLEEHIEHAKKLGMYNVYFVTNGLLLSPERRKRLMDSGLTKLFCSIDAASPETYDKQRTDRRFAKVVGNVIAFINERNAAGREWPKVLVSFLINKNNHHERKAFMEQWVGVADIVSFQRMNEVPGRDTGLTMEYTEPHSGCKFPFKQLVVDHLGNILPCCKLSGKQLEIGNIESMTLRDAWNEMHSLRRLHENGAWRSFKVCNDCLKCT